MEELLPGKVFQLQNVLKEEECNAYIQIAEKKGFKHATIAVGKQKIQNDEIRSNGTVILDDKDLAAVLWSRMKNKIPKPFTVWEDETVPVGVSDHFRIYRYEKGQQFARHYDGYEYGSMQYTGGKPTAPQPRLTFLVYLNSGFEGGATRFFNSKGTELLAVTPTTGTALIYTQRMLHEGSVVQNGVKYVLRSDVLYGQSSASHTPGADWNYCTIQ